MRLGIRFLAVLVMSAAVATGAAADIVHYDGDVVVRTNIRNDADLRVMTQISQDPWSHGVGIGLVDWRVAETDLERIEAAGIAYQVLIPDLESRVDAERQRLAQGGAAGPGLWYADFKDRAAVNARLDLLATNFPELAETFTAGQSLEGRDIRGIRITGPGDDKPAVLFNGCQHAHEWVAVMIPVYIAEQLLTQYGTSSEIQTLVDSIEFIIIPIVNPDGYEFSWTDQRLWRKNRRNNGDGTFGVDLNRNWATGWGGAGSSGDTDSETYRGVGRFSEPETQVMRDFYMANPQIVANIDFHSYSQLVLSPWGFTFAPPPDLQMYQTIGAAMADATVSVNGFSYVHGPVSTVLYLADGVSVDWTYDQRGVVSFTVELRDTGQFGFLLPPEQILPTAEENFAGALALAEFVIDGAVVSVDAPAFVPADEATTVPVTINSIAAGTLVPATAELYFRIESGMFTSTPLTWLGGNDYEMALPAAPCSSTIEYYVRIENEAGAAYTGPTDAPTDLFTSTSVAVALEDDFEADAGWTVENVAVTGGAWERGAPAGDGTRGDPLEDADGSGACWLTENAAGNTDVDGGPTRITSPAYDLSDIADPVLTFSAWFTNDDGDGDRLDVDLSDDDGASWTPAASLGAMSGWTAHSIPMSDFISPTATVRVRFSATDNPNNSVTEAGVDGLMIIDIGCEPGVPGDVDGDGIVDVADLLAVLGAWGPCPECEEDLDGDGFVGVDDILLLLANWT